MAQAKWKTFAKEQLQEIVANSSSYAEVAKAIGYQTSGGSYATMVKQMIAYYDFNIDHFTGQGWNKNNFDYDRFRKGNAIKANKALAAIVNLRGHRCECCGNSEWLGEPIALEVHHLDGDHLNNELDNLQLLCPNCHAQTENWRGKNISKKHQEQIPEEVFVEALRNNKNIRQALLSLGLTAAGGNYATAYHLIEKYNIEHLK